MASTGEGAGAAAGAGPLKGATGAGAQATATLRLKFIFANHDGVVVEYETEPTTLIKDLKVALVGRWPTGTFTAVICMMPTADPNFCDKTTQIPML